MFTALFSLKRVTGFYTVFLTRYVHYFNMVEKKANIENK